MSTITIKLMPIEMMRDIYFVEDKESFVKNSLDQYKVCKPFNINCNSFDVAEYIYDLTNNPSRQEEREDFYGRGRSVSIGDIVNVDGIDFLCDRIGFIQL